MRLLLDNFRQHGNLTEDQKDQFIQEFARQINVPYLIIDDDYDLTQCVPIESHIEREIRILKKRHPDNNDRFCYMCLLYENGANRKVTIYNSHADATHIGLSVRHRDFIRLRYQLTIGQLKGPELKFDITITRQRDSGENCDCNIVFTIIYAINSSLNSPNRFAINLNEWNEHKTRNLRERLISMYENGDFTPF